MACARQPDRAVPSAARRHRRGPRSAVSRRAPAVVRPPRASSAIWSASTTHTASNSRSSRWHPADAGLVTGPGTAPSGRPSAAACPAVLSEPDRMPASSTTVASLAAAISRLRCRNRHFVGRRAARQFGDDRAGLRDAGEERLVAERVEAIDAAGEERDRRAVAREGGAMRHAVDAVGTAGDDREPAIDETGRGLPSRRARRTRSRHARRPARWSGRARRERRCVRAPTGRSARARRARRRRGPRGIAGHDEPRADAWPPASSDRTNPRRGRGAGASVRDPTRPRARRDRRPPRRPGRRAVRPIGAARSASAAACRADRRDQRGRGRRRPARRRCRARRERTRRGRRRRRPERRRTRRPTALADRSTSFMS